MIKMDTTRIAKSFNIAAIASGLTLAFTTISIGMAISGLVAPAAFMSVLTGIAGACAVRFFADGLVEMHEQRMQATQGKSSETSQPSDKKAEPPAAGHMTP